MLSRLNHPLPIAKLNANAKSGTPPNKKKEAFAKIDKAESVGELFSIAKDFDFYNSLLDRLHSDFQKAMEEYKRWLQETESKSTDKEGAKKDETTAKIVMTVRARA
ncbi:hypothetical protein COV61_03690 [Candidatus Micrarchaeota archaeon CG11_big_fil_rev_8_21_14_0_20_47_5]|nr:MAG: hypothetical protein AUJ17_04485 [Candidatus Micrarchaeota archaeon CG1_02_47_40]PIN83234.1 MAG: hypothetical protein COV61_03690 [Candidatus Micrarchaeota archaeon CG11_big_fil_rev_8_21_14_0_20_47_5]